MTRDMDIFFEPTKTNGRRLVKALASVGYDGIENVPLETLLKKKVLARGYLFQADTHPFVKGSTFSSAWKSRVPTKIKGQTVFVPSLDELITMKQAAGREKDILDAKVLLKIKERNRRQR
jgi:hypothetical protein